MSMDTDTEPRLKELYGRERRAVSRAEAYVDARLDHPDGRLHGFVQDISFDGARFVTKNMAPRIPIGEQVVLGLTTHAAPAELSWTGTIVRCEAFIDGDSESLNYALSFDEPAPRSVHQEQPTADRGPSSEPVRPRSGAGESSGSILPPSRRSR